MTLVADFNSSVNVPFQRMRQLLLEQGGGIQEGVVGANGLVVAQRAAGANMSVDVSSGAAWVQIDTGTRNGLGHVHNDAVANVAVTASNATNPRIDQIILRWNDSSIPTGSGNVPTIEVLTGTATAGATLANRTGAAALPNDCLRLADILVPAASTTVTTANIRDRRPWARGAFYTTTITAGDRSTASTTYVDVDATNLSPRIECSGVPLRISLHGGWSHSVAGLALVAPSIDGAIVEGIGSFPFQLYEPNAGQYNNLNLVWETVPTAGSHLVTPRFAAVTAGTVTLRASGGDALRYTVEEIVRPSASNT